MSASDPKYVVFDSEETGVCAIVFPPVVYHSSIATLRKILGEPISAGFFRIQNGEAVAYGESDSLKLKSVSARDAILIDRVLRLGNFKDPA